MMLEDVVMHRGDWSGCHLRKTVSDLGEMRSEIREIAEDLAAIQRTRRESSPCSRRWCEDAPWDARPRASMAGMPRALSDNGTRE